MYTPSDELTMLDPTGNALTWDKEGPAVLREGVLMCGVICYHAGLLQQAVMRIVSAGGSVHKINTAVGDFTLSWPRRANLAARAGSESWPIL